MGNLGRVGGMDAQKVIKRARYVRPLTAVVAQPRARADLLMCTPALPCGLDNKGNVCLCNNGGNCPGNCNPLP